MTDPLGQKKKIERDTMNVHSKHEDVNRFHDELTEEIKKHPDPSKVRVIRMASGRIAVFENTRKAAEFLRNMVQEFEGWTVTLDSMIRTLNNDERISESNKKYILSNILDIKIII